MRREARIAIGPATVMRRWRARIMDRLSIEAREWLLIIAGYAAVAAAICVGVLLFG